MDKQQVWWIVPENNQYKTFPCVSSKSLWAQTGWTPLMRLGWSSVNRVASCDLSCGGERQLALGLFSLESQISQEPSLVLHAWFATNCATEEDWSTWDLTAMHAREYEIIDFPPNTSVGMFGMDTPMGLHQPDILIISSLRISSGLMLHRKPLDQRNALCPPASDKSPGYFGSPSQFSLDFINFTERGKYSNIILLS